MQIINSDNFEAEVTKSESPSWWTSGDPSAAPASP